MPKEIIMPKNGMAMEEGRLIRWLKNVGDAVEKDEPLIEIETDKITMEEPAAASGVLLAKWAEDGDVIPVLEVIGWIGESGEAVPPKPVSGESAQPQTAEQAVIPAEPSQTVTQTVNANGTMATPYAKTLAAQAGLELRSIPATGKHGEITAADVQNVKATPLAKRIAADTGVDISSVGGTGFGGKITKSDVLSAAVNAQPQARSVRKPMSGIRKAIARNMTAASSIPSVTQNTRADVTELFELRARLNQGRENKITLNDFLLMAVAKALTVHPEVLVSLDGDDVLWHSAVNLGVAVAIDGGLIVPVVKNADKMGLETLSLKVKELSAKARDNKLMQDEYSGSTFTVSNLGMYGVETFTPIINLPNAAILGACAAVDELVLADGKVEQHKKMALSLTYDHRLMDGAVAGSFSLTVKKLLENPLEILL